MSESYSSDNGSYGSLEYWKSKPPEELLEAFIHELRGPFTSIKGYIEMMRLSDSKEVHSKALDVIPKIIEKIEKDEEMIKEYLIEFKKRP